MGNGFFEILSVLIEGIIARHLIGIAGLNLPVSTRAGFQSAVHHVVDGGSKGSFCNCCEFIHRLFGHFSIIDLLGEIHARTV